MDPISPEESDRLDQEDLINNIRPNRSMGRSRSYVNGKVCYAIEGPPLAGVSRPRVRRDVELLPPSLVGS